MRALKLGEGSTQQTYICAHWRSFPPPGAGQDAEVLRAAKAIAEDEYHRLLIWQRDCGLQVMAASKCLTCPHRRRLLWKTQGQGPVLVDPNGVETAVVDMASGESAPRGSHLAEVFQRPGTTGSHQVAAWVPQGSDPDGTDG